MRTDTTAPVPVPPEVVAAYGLSADAVVQPLGTGLINTTWKVDTAAASFVLQEVNLRVFPHPEQIHENLRMIRAYLRAHAPDYPFIAPLPALNGTDLLRLPDGRVFRLFTFVEGSHTVAVATTPEQAYEAAFQFGRFTAVLAGFDTGCLQVPLPDFHNLSLRYEQLLQSLRTGNPKRINRAGPLIQALLSKEPLVQQYRSVTRNPSFPLRVMHHDTKISNVLLDANGRGVAVIDLDTVMPGYFFSDVGDMMRTYLCPVSEEESDFSRIFVREDYYTAICTGYEDAMGDLLTEAERRSFFLAGQFLIYMQALRFLTDYLKGDVYYGSAFEEQNFLRAGNQFTLLQRYTEMEG